MANNSIITKLEVDARSMNKSLDDAAKKLRAFGKDGVGSLTGMLGGFGKLVPAVAAAAGGIETFNKVVSSSQALGDQWATVQAQCKTVTEEFFYAVSNFDFSNFNNGLSDMIQRAREAYAAMDQLGNATMSYGVITAKENSNIMAQMTIMRDQTKTLEERNAAMQSARESIAAMRDAAKVVQSDLLNVINTEVKNVTNLGEGQFSFEDVLEVATRDAKLNRGELKERAEKEYQEYLKAQKAARQKYGALPGLDQTRYRDSGDPVKLREEYARLNEQYKDAIINNALLNKYKDEALQKLDDHISRYYSINDQIAANEQKLNKVGAQLDKNEQKVAKAAKAAAKETEKPLEGSLAFYNQQLAEANKALVGAATAEARAAAQAVVDEVTFKIASIKSEAVGAGGRIGLQPTATIGTNSGMSIKPSSLTNLTKSMQQSDKTIDRAKDAMQQFKEFDMSQQVDSVNALAGAFSTLGNAIGRAAGQVMALIGNMAQQVAQGVSTIANLKAQELAYKAQMNAALGSAVAETMAAHSSIPFVGVAMGVGMAATIIATLASLPKFAEGALVNQPTIGLFGEAGPEAVVPLDRLESMISGGRRYAEPQKVVFEIHDKKLSGIMSNYNERNSRHL